MTAHLKEYQFKPGQSGNPKGKPKGAKHMLAEDFVRELAADFKEFGADAIRLTREEKPDQYLKIIAAIVPKELTINEGETAIERLIDNLPDDQLADFVAGLRLLASVGEGGGEAQAAQSQSKTPAIH